jgi:Flp pilus assembly protein TadG
MQRKSFFQKFMQRFLNNQNGTVAVFTAIAAVPLLIAAGTAVDFVRLSAAQTEVQSVIDTAALAAAGLKDKTDSERIAAAQMSFDINIKRGPAASMLPVATFKIIDKAVVATVDLEMPTSFMALAGITVVKTQSHAEVKILTDKKAEVALVLDYSGSMEDAIGGGVKYLAMRDAATNLVNDLNASDPKKVKFALVPFSHHVKTTLPSAFVLGATGATWTGCTQDRKYPYNVSDATPSTAAASKWNQVMAPDHAAWDCSGYAAHNLKIVDLTDNAKKITDQLAAMTPYAWTHIALGVEFGYHVLSPNAPFTEGVAYADKNTRKFMVVLTDGEQTEPGFGPGGSRTVENGENNLAKLCDSAKANGITIITLAFDLDDTTTRQRLKDCSSNPTTDFMVAESSADLASAFQSVKQAIVADIFLQK